MNMNTKIIGMFILFLCFYFPCNAQNIDLAEDQISFAQEDKPHSYYVKQAGLWWQRVQEDSSNEKAWYNYYRACRNAQGTANWRTDFVNEAPFLKLGDEIVELMEIHIPNSFTLNFVKGSTGGVSPEAGAYLMKAYEMNSTFPGLLPSVVTFATSTHNYALRQEANQKWFQQKEQHLPVSLLNYAYNNLNSVAPNGILFTQHDNDTYPVWMLQDVHKVRHDVLVINIDFLLYEGYREVIFDQLGIPPFILPEVNVDEYEINWKNVVEHFLGTYNGNRPVHISLTVSEQWYSSFKEKLTINGLTKTFLSKTDNTTLFKNTFLLDHLKHDFEYTLLQSRIDEMNINYLHFFDAFWDNLNQTERDKIQSIAKNILLKNQNNELISEYSKRFRLEL